MTRRDAGDVLSFFTDCPGMDLDFGFVTLASARGGARFPGRPKRVFSLPDVENTTISRSGSGVITKRQGDTWKADMEYVFNLPKAVPVGKVLVHNHVRPTLRLGFAGFRAWLDDPGGAYEICDCGWAPKLSEHYRVARAKQCARL